VFSGVRFCEHEFFRGKQRRNFELEELETEENEKD